MKAQEWTVVDNSFIPSFSNAVSGPETGGTNTKVVSDLQGLPKDGTWRTFYANGSASASLHPKDNPDVLLTMAGRSGSGYWTQNYTSFSVSDDVLQSQGARISFDVTFLASAGSIGSFVEVAPWIVREQGVELRRQTITRNTKFLFGLVNNATGEIYQADFSTGGSQVFDYGSNNYKIVTDEDGKLTVSFLLNGSDLANIDADGGLSMIIETTWGGGSDDGEYYTIGNLRVETLSAVPEPAVYAALSGLAALGLAALRRRK
ncbi:hypothetical protein OPIT5_11240 [Opitutaceae bacterium TAV5]|nr:hypothetical protein OPIT5_11240 [Opitutaceae bacterium TAV5]